MKQAILQIVDNQLKNSDPPETKETYDRLIASGKTDEEARRLLGCIVISEIVDVLKNEQPFDRARFVKALNELPLVPEE